MKGRTHDIVIVSREDAQAGPLSEIPEPQSLIVGGAQNPRKLCRVGMELHRSDVIQVSQESKEAAAEFVIPNLDFVIVSSGDDERFVEVEVDATDGTVVFFEAVYYRAYAVVPSVNVGGEKREVSININEHIFNYKLNGS